MNRDSQPDTRSARERAYHGTKQRILDGTYEGGSLLNEADVAETIGASRTPVRDAFLSLEAEGFLRLYPRRGALVVPVSADEIRWVLEAREVIEEFAARRVCGLPAAERSDLVASLRPFLAEQDEAVAGGDDAAFARADRGFHEAVVAAAGNPILADHYTALRDRQVRMNLVAFARDDERTRQNLADHQAMADAISVSDESGLVGLMASHIDGIAAVLGVRR